MKLIILLIAGISIIPSINEKIKGLINNEKKVEKYKVVRNILTVVFFLIFMVKAPITTKTDDQQTVNKVNKIDVNTNINK